MINITLINKTTPAHVNVSFDTYESALAYLDTFTLGMHVMNVGSIQAVLVQGATIRDYKLGEVLNKLDSQVVRCCIEGEYIAGGAVVTLNNKKYVCNYETVIYTGPCEVGENDGLTIRKENGE